MAISSTYIFGHRRKAKKTLGYLIARSFRTNWKTQRSPNLVEALSKNLPGLLHATFVRVAIRCVYRSPTVNALVNEKVHDCVSTDRARLKNLWVHGSPVRIKTPGRMRRCGPTGLLWFRVQIPGRSQQAELLANVADSRGGVPVVTHRLVRRTGLRILYQSFEPSGNRIGQPGFAALVANQGWDVAGHNDCHALIHREGRCTLHEGSAAQRTLPWARHLSSASSF